jgi:hypothetical protein
VSIWPESERATETVSFRVPPSVKRRILELKDLVSAATMAELFRESLNYYGDSVHQTQGMDAEVVLRTWPNGDRRSAPIEMKLATPWLEPGRLRGNDDLSF